MTIATTLLTVDVNDGAMTRKAPLQTHGERRALRYGENPHQEAYWQVMPESMGRTWQVHQGKELSYTNLLDLDAAVRIALEFPEPAGVVIKHTNPCGVATGTSAADAYVRAREADPLSAFGGIVAINRVLDGETAAALTSTFIEAVIAPAWRTTRGRFWRRRRTCAWSRPISRRWRSRCRSATSKHARFSAACSSSNAIASRKRAILAGRRPAESRHETRADRIRVDGAALRVARLRPRQVERGHLHGRRSHACRRRRADEPRRRGEGRDHEGGRGGAAASVAASDAFFPFRDGLDALAAAGATAVVQPGGSVRDAEVIAAADEHGLAMVFTGKRHFRHWV